eukprot:UN26262
MPQVFIPEEMINNHAIKEESNSSKRMDCPICRECPVCPEKECPKNEEKSIAYLDEGQCPVWWPWVQESYFPKVANEKFVGVMGQGWWFLGCKSDVDEVLDILKPFYRGADKDGVFVDIGANLGQVTENIIQTFGNIPWNKYKRKFGLEGLYCKNDPNPGAEVYMFEPQPNNAKRIRERMEDSSWNLERIKLIEAAVVILLDC